MEKQQDEDTEKELLIDINCLYVGLEDYRSMINGEIYNVKSYELYALTGFLKSNNIERYFFTNVGSADEFVLDENNNLLRYIKADKEDEVKTVYGITGLKPFKESIDVMLKATGDLFGEDEPADIMFYKQIQESVKAIESQGRVPFLTKKHVAYAMGNLDDLYNISYGDIRQGKSQLECINEKWRNRDYGKI